MRTPCLQPPADGCRTLREDERVTWRGQGILAAPRPSPYCRNGLSLRNGSASSVTRLTSLPGGLAVLGVPQPLGELSGENKPGS